MHIKNFISISFRNEVSIYLCLCIMFSVLALDERSYKKYDDIDAVRSLLIEKCGFFGATLESTKGTRAEKVKIMTEHGKLILSPVSGRIYDNIKGVLNEGDAVCFEYLNMDLFSRNRTLLMSIKSNNGKVMESREFSLIWFKENYRDRFSFWLFIAATLSFFVYLKKVITYRQK